MKVFKKYKLEITLLIIVVTAIIPIVINIYSLSNQELPEGQTIEISMAGFNPSTIQAKVGEEMKIKLVNPDNSAHLDGGGWHQFASDELDFNFKLGPESSQVITIQADQPGEYEFYCDICCGGRENPSMQGKVIIS